MASKRRYWLMKSEPTSYSIDDLERDGVTPWDGVRNYQARNLMRDELQVGDLALFYHSSADPTGVAGIAKVCRTGYPDHTAWDRSDHHFDPKSTAEAPIWIMVDVEFVEKFPRVVPLRELKDEPSLEGMMVTRRGMRLSVQPVERTHFEIVRKLGKRKPE